MPYDVQTELPCVRRLLKHPKHLPPGYANGVSDVASVLA